MPNYYYEVSAVVNIIILLTVRNPRFDCCKRECIEHTPLEDVVLLSIGTCYLYTLVDTDDNIAITLL